MNLSEVLQKNPHTAELSQRERDALGSAMSVSSHPAGHVFIKEGKRGDTMFMLLEGEVAVTRERAEGSHELKTLKPGELFGQLALIDDEPRAATCVAVGPVKVAALPHAAFSLLFHAHAPVAEALQRAVTAQVMSDFRNVTRQIHEALGKEPVER